MREIGDRTMAVLKVKGVEKLFGLLLADLLERLLHGKRRARILGHGVGLNLRVHAVHGKYVDLRAGASPVLFCRGRLGGGGVWHGSLILFHPVICSMQLSSSLLSVISKGVSEPTFS